MDKNLDQDLHTKLPIHPRYGEIGIGIKIFFFIILHIGLAFVMRSFQILATIHAYLVFLIAVWIALTSKDLGKVAALCAYIMGAEVLWRMTNAQVFWEFSKYAIVVIFVIALFRYGKTKGIFLPIGYFFLLLPASAITITELGFTTATRSTLSFNLAGPLAAMVSMIFFQQIQANEQKIGSWVWAMVYPIVSILTIALYSTVTAEDLVFISESNFTTSGGFGPNQVSAILGLGALVLFLYTILHPSRHAKIWALLLGIIMTIQSILTLSRGGIVNLIVAFFFALLHLVRRLKRGISSLLFILVILAVSFYFALPRLNEFTGGMLETRYSELETSGREEIAREDFELFKQQPLLGIGVGMSPYYRNIFNPNTQIAAHTEYSRVLAEHGVLGIISILLLILNLWVSYRRAPKGSSKAWIVAFIVWALVEMAHSAMRVASISFMLGLATVGWGELEGVGSSYVAIPKPHSRSGLSRNPVNQG